MTVLLRSHAADASCPPWQDWVSIDADLAGLDQASRKPKLGTLLEQAFDAVATQWLDLARDMGQDKGAGLAHAPSAAPNPSDFGLMLAWSHLVQSWAKAETVTLVLCNDPWLYRHLSRIEGVNSAAAPPLLLRSLKLWLRGFFARSLYALTTVRLALRQRGSVKSIPPKQPSLLVYGHPRSTLDGYDAYFGDLMSRHPQLIRILHVDAREQAVARLRHPGRTISLHGFGSPFWAICHLPLARWKPRQTLCHGQHGWLVRRASSLENGTAQPAAIMWQNHCQRRWLKRAQPSVVLWPWENHGWERQFVRDGQALGIRLIGYQHSVIGRQMLNYAPASNVDALNSIPAHILCTGLATQEQLTAWGIPPQRLHIGGARRSFSLGQGHSNPTAPIYLALPFDGAIAHQMVEAARIATRAGWQFLIKDHPMTPFAFIPSKGLERSTAPLSAIATVGAVVFAATTVGLEAAIMGLPVLRFRPHDRIALDIFPAGLSVAVTESETLADNLRTFAPSPPLEAARIFAPVDHDLWQRLLNGDVP